MLATCCTFISEFISRFGVPRQIVTDQRRQFESHLFQELCNKLGKDKTHCSPFHPQTNGLCERVFKTLADMLAKIVKTNQRD
jgi:transposase InsO family protein